MSEVLVLDSEKIDDPYVRECMEKISEAINGSKFVSGKFDIFEVNVTNTTTKIKSPHGLKYTPTDVFVSWVNPTSTIAIRYDLVDENNIVFTSSAACKVRFIVGRAK